MEVFDSRNYDMLDEAIGSCLETINSLNPENESEVYTTMVNNLQTLSQIQRDNRRFEEDKILREAQFDSDEDQRKVENEQKEAQIKKDLWSNVGRWGLEFVGGLISMGALILFEGTWRKRTMLFEQDGIFTSQTGKRIMQEKFPKIFKK